MRIMIPQPIHILIPPLTRRDLTTKRSQPPLRLALGEALEGGELGRGGEVALAVRDVVFEPVGLFVGFHAAWFGAFERLLEEEGGGGAGEGGVGPAGG